MKIINNVVAAILFSGMLAMPLSAQQKEPQRVSLNGDVKAVETTVDEDGNERVELVDLGVTVPGDRLMFIIEYSNDGAEAATNFVITNAVHQAVTLAPDADRSLVVSVDGGKAWGTLDTLQVAEDDGSARAATQSDVTHVRWTLASIEPGQSGRVEFPAIIR